MTVTADSTLYTADGHYPTADGFVPAVTAAAVVEAAIAADVLDAVSIISATALEAATAVDSLDAVSIFAADVAESADALDQIDAAIGAQVLFGTVDEPAAALDQLDADVQAAEVPAAVGGGRFYPRRRPLPVVGHGFGILPQLEGEAHGVVGVAGAGVGALSGLVGETTGAAGVAGRSAAKLLVRAMATGASGTRGSGSGTIVKFSGSATGHQDDDEAAVIAILLAA